MSEISTNVGTELLFENDRVRVWSMALEPGESSPLHCHEHDYLYVYTTPDNEIRLEREGEAPMVQCYDEHFVQFSTVGSGLVHRITNVGKVRHHQVLVELKGPSAAATPQPPQNNGRLC